MFFSSKSRRIEELESKIEQLEKQNLILMIALQGIQTNLMAASQVQETIAKDVREIQSFVEHLEKQMVVYNYDSKSEYD
jgi:hypothetical protein